ncbi:MAG: hypothetical protein LBK56_04630 [Gracilibacteraceae bacterium]|nr:hypothetical protein [Gracilibacteraceae bacterium]
MDFTHKEEVRETTVNKRFAESPLGQAAEHKIFDKPASEYGKPLGLAAMESKNETTDAIDIKEYKLAKCIEIVRKRFTEKIQAEWGGLSASERKKIFGAYQRDIAKELGIKNKGVRYDITEPGGVGYNLGDGVIHLHKGLLDDPKLILLGIDAIAHESRHQFQTDVILGNICGVVSNSVIAAWISATETYASSGSNCFDPEGYFYNPLEADARHFGEGIASALRLEANGRG